MVLPHLGQASRGSAYRCVLEPQANQVKDVKINAWLQVSHQLKLYARGLAIRIAALNTFIRTSKYRPDFCHKALLAVRQRLQLPFRFIVVKQNCVGHSRAAYLSPSALLMAFLELAQRLELQKKVAHNSGRNVLLRRGFKMGHFLQQCPRRSKTL